LKKLIILALIAGNLLYAEDFEEDGSLIYDSKTELSWQKKPSTKKMQWQEAKNYCEDLELRLPNLYELKSLVDYGKYNPAIRTSLIDIQTDDWYWSSSIYKGKSDSSSAWGVNFKNGFDFWGSQTNTYSVLCVSGQ